MDAASTRLKSRTARISTTIAFSESPEKTTASSAIIVNPIPFFREIGVISSETEIKPESRMITVTNLHGLKVRTVIILDSGFISVSLDITSISLKIGIGLTIMALLAVVFSGDSENAIVVEIRAVRVFNH